MPQARESSRHDAPVSRHHGDEDTVRSRIDDRTASARDDTKDILREIEEALPSGIAEESVRDQLADAIVRSYVRKGGE